MKEIEQLWEYFQNKPYPENFAGMEIDGVNLVEIDTFLAGCISTFIKNGYKLDSNKASILRECMADLGKVKDKINGEGEDYFLLLHTLGTIVKAELE